MGEMHYWLSVLTAMTAQVVSAQELYFQCEGQTPDWSITMTGNTGSLSYIGASDMTIPQVSRAEGRIWPLALTMISDDFSRTAVVILNERSCQLGEADFDYEAQILTQRQDLPVLLTGCCRTTASDQPEQ